MAACLDYQTVYSRRSSAALHWWMQLVAAVMLLATLSAKVWIKIETTDLGYQLAEERKLTVEYDMQRRELELQRSVLLRPDMLRKAAKARLGMDVISPDQARKLSY
ncbi:MAG: hypothetical protein K1X79_12520 [Oligoflexia bacterium]|nr:hypothetical protein [Oligoflexia bacterium]